MTDWGSGADLDLIDTHCHLDAAEFDTDRDQQRELARQLGVVRCVIPAVAASQWRAVTDLAHRHGDVYALGIHPLYAARALPSDAAALADALSAAMSDSALVAVGEIGLDGFEPQPDAALQMHWLRTQLGLAREFQLPVILHVRRAVDLVLRELRRCPVPGGIAHAFNGSLQQAHACIDMGLALGFGGALTFERALQLRRLACKVPLSALVLETDAPDMVPQWLYQTAHQRSQGLPQGRNSPAQLPRIAAHLAELRQLPLAELARTCADNARRSLRWPGPETGG